MSDRTLEERATTQAKERLPTAAMPEVYERRPLSEVLPTSIGKEEMAVCLRLLGTSSLKEEAVWHICSKKKLWSQRNTHC
jgi:hypothetical protein